MNSNNKERISSEKTITAEELAIFSEFKQQLSYYKEANTIIPTLAKNFPIEKIRLILFKNNLEDLDAIVNTFAGNRKYTLINYFVAIQQSREGMIQGRVIIHAGQKFAEDFCELFSKPDTAALALDNFKKGFQRLNKKDREAFASRWHECGTDTMLTLLLAPPGKLKRKRQQSRIINTAPLEKIDETITHNEVIIYRFIKMLCHVNYKNNFLRELVTAFYLENIIRAILDTKLRYLSEVLFNILPQDNRYVFLNYFLCTLERRQIISRGTPVTSQLKQDLDPAFLALYANENEAEKNTKSLEIALQQLSETKQNSIRKRFKEKTLPIEILQTIVNKLPLPVIGPQTNLLESLSKIFLTQPDLEESLLKNQNLITRVKVPRCELPPVVQQRIPYESISITTTEVLDDAEESRVMKRQKLQEEQEDQPLFLQKENTVAEQAEESIWKDLLLDQLDSLEHLDSPDSLVNYCNELTVESQGSSLGLFGLFANHSEKIQDQDNKGWVIDTQMWYG